MAALRRVLHHVDSTVQYCIYRTQYIALNVAVYVLYGAPAFHGITSENSASVMPVHVYLRVVLRDTIIDASAAMFKTIYRMGCRHVFIYAYLGLPRHLKTNARLS